MKNKSILFLACFFLMSISGIAQLNNDVQFMNDSVADYFYKNYKINTVTSYVTTLTGTTLLISGLLKYSKEEYENPLKMTATIIYPNLMQNEHDHSTSTTLFVFSAISLSAGIISYILATSNKKLCVSRIDYLKSNDVSFGFSFIPDTQYYGVTVYLRL